MPLYEFECPLCKSVMESLVKMGTETIKCQCGSTANRKLSAGSFILKGTGWYQTDFKNNKKPHGG